MQWMTAQERHESREMMMRFRKRQEEQNRWQWEQMTKEYGVKMTCIGDINAEIERQDTISRTCKACGLICSNYDNKARHHNSDACRRRIASQRGVVFVPESKMPKYCIQCRQNVQLQSWKRHLVSKKHRDNESSAVEHKWFCPLCDKNFNTRKRPMRCFRNHVLHNKQHLRLCKLNMGLHNQLLEQLPKIHNTQVV